MALTLASFYTHFKKSHKTHHAHINCFSSSPQQSTSPRPAVILPGLGNNSGDYEKLQLTLTELGGVPSVVAKVARVDWIRNAAGLADVNYWRGTLRPRPVLDWYLNRIDEAVKEAKELGAGGTLSLIGHSAGGWLARLYMEEFGASDIFLLLTLGTPHQPPPRGSPGVIDQTRGLLYYVEQYCAKAVYNEKLKYVCIAGRYIEGARIFEDPDLVTESTVLYDIDQPNTDVVIGLSNSDSASRPPATIRARFVGQGYKQASLLSASILELCIYLRVVFYLMNVCGRAEVWGDGVVPEVSAHLEGALNISFDGVYHSPVGSDDNRPWYGSPAIVQKWIHHLLD